MEVSMLLKKLLSFFLLFIIINGYEVFGQSVTGKVVDAESQEPLSGVNIKHPKSNRGTTTTTSGTFVLKLPANFKPVIQISHIGYQPRLLWADTLDKPIIITLTPKIYQSEGVSISAVRADTDSPVSQTTIAKNSLEQVYVGEDPVFSLEKLTPSILSHSESGSGFANYSLMRLRGIDQSRINITLNGVPLNDMIDQGVFFSNFTDFGNSIQSVQVQRGVGTSTNGTASYAGSINFESQQIKTGEPEATFNFTGGSFGSYRAGGEVQTGSLKNKFGIYSKFTKTLSEGYKFHSGTNSSSFFFSGGYFGGEHVIKITSFFGRTKNELAFLPVLIDDIREEPRTNPLSENDEDDFTQQFVQIEHNTGLGSAIQVNSSIYYGGAGGDFPFSFTDQGGSFVQQNFRLENDHFGLMSSLDYTPSNAFKLTAGLHTYRFNRINEEAFAPDLENPYYADDSRKDEFSSFIKAEYRLGEFKLYGDLQVRSVWLDFDPDKSFLVASGLERGNLGVPTRTWTFFNPKVGVTYFINNKLNIYASFGRTGREPTRNDVLGTTNINPFNLEVVQDVNSVKEEYVNDVESGIRFKTSRFQTKINAFFMEFDDEISATGDFIPAGFVQLRENIANSRRFGVELEWDWQPWYKLSVHGNTTYMDSNIDTFSPGGSNQEFKDVDAVLTPEWLMNGTIAYQVNEWFQVTFSGRYVSDSFLELTNQAGFVMPSYFRLDTGLNLNFSNRLTGNITINNLTDNLYFTNGAPVDADGDGTIDGPGFLVQPPINAFAEIKIHL